MHNTVFGPQKGLKDLGISDIKSLWR